MIRTLFRAIHVWSLCLLCSGILFSPSSISPHPSNPTRLTILDETDYPIDHERVAGDRIWFLAKYSKLERGESISEATVTFTCEPAGIFDEPMAYFPAKGWYYYSIKTDEDLIEGYGSLDVPWSVHAEKEDYDPQDQSNNVMIFSQMSELVFILQDFESDCDPTIIKDHDEYPRLLNHFMMTRHILHDDQLNEELAQALAHWDIFVPSVYNIRRSGPTPQINTHFDIHKSIKDYNPDTQIFLYVPGGQFPTDTLTYADDSYAADVNEEFEEDWWVYAPSGEKFPDSPNAWKMINYTYETLTPTGSVTYPAADFMAAIIFQMFDSFESETQERYDGVWLDLIRGEHVLRKWFLEDSLEIDFDRNGCDDITVDGVPVDEVIEKIQTGYVNLFDAVRSRLENEGYANPVLLGNPGWPWQEGEDDELFDSDANGNMMEGFEPIEKVVTVGIEGAWLNSEPGYTIPERLFNIYLQHADRDPSKNDHWEAMRRKVRYALTAALMTDAYFASDEYSVHIGGHHYHNSVWWFPEYNCNLELPVSTCDTLEHNGNKYMIRGFEHGLVINNNHSLFHNQSDSTITVDYSPNQYFNVSTGERGSSFTIPIRDGVILLEYPQLDDPEPPEVTMVGHFYSYNYSLKNEPYPGAVWDLTTEHDFLSISETGELYGTPDESDIGRKEVIVSVRDGHGGFDEHRFMLEVKRVQQAKVPR